MDINQIMKQAQMMQQKMEELQSKLESKEYVGISGGEMVKATINGKGKVLEIKLSPEVVDPSDIEVLEDLILAALNDARKKQEEDSSNVMGGMLGGMKMPPGLKMPF